MTTTGPAAAIWLQHGLGRGVHGAVPEAVFGCVTYDYRWDRQVDERAVYLARLIRDLSMPVPPLLALLREDPTDDDATVFDNTLEVLEALGRAGDRDAIDGLRRYVGDGPRWVDVLHTIADGWPGELWNDLLPVARTRLGHQDRDDEVLWNSRPWCDWAAVDDMIATRSEAWRPRSGPPRPFADQPTEDLLALLRTGEPARQNAVLRELNRRGPQPDLLTVADALPAAELRASLGRAVRMLGAQAVPLARSWVTPPDHPLAWTAHRVLAGHGDDADLPALLARWDWLAGRGARCGYDTLADGIARIGGPAARVVVPRLRRAWLTPHSYERAAYLRAIVALDPGDADQLLVEGLWDCESDVRWFAATHAPLDGLTRDRLGYLRDDPMETAGTRTAAAARLTG